MTADWSFDSLAEPGRVGLAAALEAALASDDAQIVTMLGATGVPIPEHLRGNLVHPAAQVAAETARSWLAHRLADAEFQAEVKAAVKAQAMDRFTADYLADDAREWLAGFASRAALAEVAAALDDTS